MQASDEFIKVIQAHLDGLAENDSLFAETLKKPGKNIKDCTTYIINQVKKSGRNGFADSEIFGMAVHYYDEDKIDVGQPVGGQVVVNHTIDKQSSAKPATKSPAKTPEAAKPVKKEQKVYATLFDSNDSED